MQLVFRSSVPKFEAFKSWRALLVPLLTLVTVAVTGWMQSSQLARTGEANDGNREDGARPAEYETIDTDQATGARDTGDRKSTRLNSSHGYISYAVFCLKKKKKKTSAAGPRDALSAKSSKLPRMPR